MLTVPAVCSHLTERASDAPRPRQWWRPRGAAQDHRCQLRQQCGRHLHGAACSAGRSPQWLVPPASHSRGTGTSIVFPSTYCR